MIETDTSFYKGLLDHMSDGVYFVDRNRQILYWNEGAYRLSGYKSKEMLGKFCQDDILCHIDATGRRLCQDGCPLSATVETGESSEAKVFLRHKQGRRVPVHVRVQAIRDTAGSVVGAVEIFSDDSAHYEAHRKVAALERLAFLDQLTQLPNRRFVEMSLRTALTEYQVHNDPFGLLVIDLDQFKEINDSFGHLIGDFALQEVAKTLTGSLRPTDVVARWGGDEFIAIIRNMNQELLKELAERCVTMVGQTSFPSGDGRTVALSVSVGGTLSRPSETIEKFINEADERMYSSKTNGRNRATTE
ncbi:MAG: sensor domain-containing diguanylate cyclase [Acidobacteriaceae bacterium]|nr:sensor domain-containing diguanylate cyclase [Acidobacteriaceae bacterium]